MKGFWKWFFIVLGILVLIGIAFTAALFFFRGGPVIGARSGFGMMRFGGFGVRGPAMMFGFGGLMLLRLFIPLGILVLAGFGVAYFVKYSKRPVEATAGGPGQPAAEQPTCAHCGKTLSADWSTCPYCGTKIEPPAVNPPQA